jgi:hypothetical protein
MKELTESQHRLLESLNGLSHISSKDVKALVEFARENIDPTINICTTCSDAVRKLVRRVQNWYELNRKIDLIWDIDENDMQALEAQETPTDVMVCEHCGKETMRKYYKRFHGDLCKFNPDNNE